MSMRRRAIAAAGLLLLSVLWAGVWLEAGVQEVPPTSVKADAAEPGQGHTASTRPAKERMAVYVLLAWVWISVAVLLGFLRLRVREADRVHRMGLFRAGGGSTKDPGR